MVDLTNILSRKADSFEPPKQLPPGGYLFRVKNFTGERNGKEIKSASGNAGIDMEVEALQPLDGVEAEALAGIEFPKNMRHTFWMTEAAGFRLTQFLENSLKLQVKDRTLGDIIPDAQGAVFRGNVIHRPAQNDASRFYAEISEMYPAD